jgi:hypothetical protein
MAPKLSKLTRLQELDAFVRQPDKLAELQARSGNDLKEKLKQQLPEEKPWYDFLRRSSFPEADCQALLEELDAEVACPPAQQNASHGSSSASSMPTNRRASASDRPTESVPAVIEKRPRTQMGPPTTVAETLCLRRLNIHWPFSQLILMGAKTEEVRTHDLGKHCEARQEMWIVETKGKSARSTANAICGGLELEPRPDSAQIVGTVTFDDSHQYDNLRADAELCSTV